MKLKKGTKYVRPWRDYSEAELAFEIGEAIRREHIKARRARGNLNFIVAGYAVIDRVGLRPDLISPQPHHYEPDDREERRILAEAAPALLRACREALQYGTNLPDCSQRLIARAIRKAEGPQ